MVKSNLFSIRAVWIKSFQYLNRFSQWFALYIREEKRERVQSERLVERERKKKREEEEGWESEWAIDRDREKKNKKEKKKGERKQQQQKGNREEKEKKSVCLILLFNWLLICLMEELLFEEGSFLFDFTVYIVNFGNIADMYVFRGLFIFSYIYSFDFTF